MKNSPAQIVFLEDERARFKRGGNGCGRWVGHLLNPSTCIDVQRGKPIVENRAPRFIIEEQPDGSCRVTMRGGHYTGTRYAVHPDVTAAQKAGIRWAGRRFRVADGDWSLEVSPAPV